MQKEFIPFTESLAMKELGFDEICFAIFNKKEFEPLECGPMNVFGQNKNSCYKKNIVAAPLYQQAFRWFREKHGLVSYLRWNDSYKPISWEWAIEGEKFGGETECREGWIYEQAELACLQKLIKIVQDGKS